MMTASNEADFAFQNGIITGYTGSGGDVVIPATIGGQAVTSVGAVAFADCTTLTSITLPESLTSVGELAFYRCTGLTSITLPESLTSVGESAFYMCTGLRSVSLPTNLTSIGDSAFLGCTGLTSITLPAGLTSVGFSVFAGCTGLTSISFPASLTSIGYSAFEGCPNLTSLTFPASLTSIDEWAFSGCVSLTSITLPANLTSVSGGAFSSCFSLTSITLPAGLTRIGYSAFSDCTGLTSIILPAGLTNIDEWAFSGCTALTSIYFLGDAPVTGTRAFLGTAPDATIYYRAGTTGWTNPFVGLPTAVATVASAPSELVITATTVAEHSALGTTVGALNATDPDVGDSFTYNLISGTGDTDNVLFEIVGNELRTKAVFDFETKNSYSVRVRTTDQGGLTFEKAFTITVANVNEAPTNVILSATSIAENAGANAVVGTLSSSDPDAGNTFTYTLVPGTGSTDNAAFNISGNQLRARASLNFEAKNSYSVRVRTTDQGGLTFEKAFTITVTNVNEAPTNVVLSAGSIAENAGVNAVVGTLSSTDPDAGNTFTYTLVSGTGSTDNAAFNISGNQLRATASLNFETKNSYSVRVRTTDQGGRTFEKAFTITVTNVNEAPTAVTLSASSVSENQAFSTFVGSLSTNDPDASSITTYSLVPGLGDADNALFEIVSTTLRTRHVFDYESRNAYTIRVRATDSYGLYTEEAFGITVADIDETPPSYLASTVVVSASLKQSGNEGRACSTVFEITRTGGVLRPLTVQLGLLGTAAPGRDYSVPAGMTGYRSFSVELSAGESSTTVALATLQDTDYDPTETVGVVVFSGTGYMPAPGQDRAIAIIGAEGVSGHVVEQSFADSTNQGARNRGAFAAVRNDGTLVSWGDSSYGGNFAAQGSPGSNASFGKLFSTQGAFAAIRADGAVVFGGATSEVAIAPPADSSITEEVALSSGSIAVTRSDGSVSVSGNPLFGGNPGSLDFDGPSNELGVTQLASTWGAFAALRSDNAVLVWGDKFYGGQAAVVDQSGNSAEVTVSSLGDSATVRTIYSNPTAFAAVRTDGSVVTWGRSQYGGASSHVDFNGPREDLRVLKIFSTDSAFAALRDDGSVVSWGLSSHVGNSATIDFVGNAGELAATHIASTNRAFAAVRRNGTAVAWGVEAYGGNSTTVDFDGPSDDLRVVQIYATSRAFAALRSDGSVVTWGDPGYGGDASGIDFRGPSGDLKVVEIVANASAFVALCNDGSIVSWGSTYGGDSSLVDFDGPDNNLSVVRVFASWAAFAALRSDGSVITWGGSAFGGESTTVDFNGQANNLRVAHIATPFLDVSVDAAPSATLSCTKSFLIVGEPAEITVTVSEPITSLPLEAFSCQGAEISQLSGDGSVFRVLVTPLASQTGRVTVSLPQNSFKDSAGTGSIASTELVIPVRHAPTKLALGGTAIAENNFRDSVIGVLDSSDPDVGDTFTYSLVSGTGDTDNSSFEIVGNQLRTREIFDYETKNSYAIRVRTTDSVGLFVDSPFAVTITNVNEPPSTIALSASSIAENAGANSVVGTLSTSDPDIGDTFTYSLISGTGDTNNDSFQIVGNQLRTRAVFDYESKSTYSVRVRGTDSAGLTTEQALSLGVTQIKGAIGTHVVDARQSVSFAGVPIMNFEGPEFEGIRPLPYIDLADSATRPVPLDVTGLSHIDISASGFWGIQQGSETGPAGNPTSLSDTTEAYPAFGISRLNNAPLNLLVGVFVDGTLFDERQPAPQALTYSGSTVASPALFQAFPIGALSKGISVPNGATRLYLGIHDGYEWVNNVGTVAVVISPSPAAPTDIAISLASVPENRVEGTLVGMFNTTDPNSGDSFIYSLVPGAGDTNNASFQIVDGQLRTKAVFDYESKSTYSIRVRSTDQSGRYVEKQFVIDIADSQELVQGIAFEPQFRVSDGIVMSRLGQLRLKDAVARQYFTLTLVDGVGSDDNSLFRLNGTTLFNLRDPGLTQGDQYSVRVRVSDGQSVQDFVVPVVVPENLPSRWARSLDLGDVVAGKDGFGGAVTNLSDVDGIDPSTGLFVSDPNIGHVYDSGFKTVAPSPLIDGVFILRTGLPTTITSSGVTFSPLMGDGQSVSFDNITHGRENGTGLPLILDGVAYASGIGMCGSTGITFPLDAFLSQHGVHTVRLTADFGRMNGPGDIRGYVIFSNAATVVDSHVTDVVSDSSESSRYIDVPIPVGAKYVTLAAGSVGAITNDHGVFGAVSLSVVANAKPSNIVNSASAIAENGSVGTLVGALSTADPDLRDTFTYSLISGTGDTNNSSFEIVGNELRTKAVFDFETKNSYSIRVRTTDQGGLTFEEAFTITVTNVNEAPTNLALSSTSVAENTGANAVVGTFSSTDPDAGNTFTYTLVSGTASTDNAAFNILGNQLRATAGFEFETKNSYSVRVRTTDQGGLTFEKAFTITVTNVNEAPTNITLSSASIAENGGANAVVGTLSSTDPDAGNTFTYTLVPGTGSTDNAAFNISGNQLRATASFNFESRNSYLIRVRTTDQGGLTFEKAFTITVTNVNEAPTNIALSSTSIAENAGGNAVVGTLSSTDPDAGNTFTYTLVSGTGSTDNAAFNISGNQLRATASLNFETKNSYSVRVRTTDQGGRTFEKAFTITVTNVNEAPTNIALSSTSIAENAGANAVVGTLSSTDPDAGNTFTYTLVPGTGSTDNAAFNIWGNQLRAKTSFDFETKNSYSVRVRTTDQGGLFIEKVFNVWVRDVVEAPVPPTSVVGTPSNSRVTLTWAPRASNGGATITDYVIQYRATTASTWTTFEDGVSTSRSATVTGLTNGVSYVFRVAAKNAAGTGAFSAISRAVTPRLPTLGELLGGRR